MPEKPEVVTVAKTLENRLIGKEIKSCDVYWDSIIMGDKDAFIKEIKNQKIEKITTRGKWLVFYLTSKALLVHLRMEGKFFFREKGTKREKHEHVIFLLDDGMELRFHDVRKFGKMMLLPKNEIYELPPLSLLGYEYNDERLTVSYLRNRFKNKTLPIKTVLLDQSIIAGIGNIYDDEILFLSHISPLRKAKNMKRCELESIIFYTKEVLDKAITMGGTTIKSFTSSEGVHGRFQNELSVHGKKDGICPICKGKIKKIKVGGRGTYYCPNCQK